MVMPDSSSSSLGLAEEHGARVCGGEQYGGGFTFRNGGKGGEDASDIQASRCRRNNECIRALSNRIKNGLVQRGRVNRYDSLTPTQLYARH